MDAIPQIAQGLTTAAESWDGGVVLGMVQERALHLAIEVVTDVGSYLIDGFIMRDASSYEDIMEINHEEKVFDQEIFDVLLKLVSLRKPLVQDYYSWSRSELHPLTPVLPEILNKFAAQVRDYIQQELVM
nr:HepT-like ribonuclease domain-containing protein [Paenibacillus dendrobii]